MKERHNNIIPECYADTVLVEILGFSYPNHSPLNNVSHVLRTIKGKRPKEKVVGIIDSDRGRSEKYLKKDKLLRHFNLVGEEEGIKKYTFENQTILILYPAFEGWIFDNADQNGLDTSKYGFPTSKEFKKACKDVEAKNNDRLKQFLNALKQKNASGFLQLKSWICEGIGVNEDDIQ